MREKPNAPRVLGITRFATAQGSAWDMPEIWVAPESLMVQTMWFVCFMHILKPLSARFPFNVFSLPMRPKVESVSLHGAPLLSPLILTISLTLIPCTQTISLEPYYHLSWSCYITRQSRRSSITLWRPHGSALHQMCVRLANLSWSGQ
jgi:hypothetical protein